MKHYKLLKDLPTIKAGTIFEEQERHGYRTLAAKNIGRLYEIDADLIENFDEWFEEIKSFVVPDEFEMGFWTIMHGDDGFYTWFLPSDEFEEDYEEKLKQHMELDWAFKTEKEAEDFLEWSKARAVIKQDTKGFKPNWYNHHQSKWSVEYDYDDSSLEVWHETFNKTAEFYFETYEDAENSINNHREEWMTYLGVKE